MCKTTTAALEARIDVLSVALQELARLLAPAQAGQVIDAVRQRVAERAAGPLSPAADEAISVELAPLLAALRATGVGQAHPVCCWPRGHGMKLTMLKCEGP